jgi:hypothetical protein
MLIPFPVKIQVVFKEMDLKVYLYKFKVFSLIETLKKKTEKDKKKCKPKKEKKKKKKLVMNLSVVQNIIYKLNNNPIKPKIRLYYDINYSTGDAASTAILYGIIYQAIAVLSIIISVLLNITINKTDIAPNFQSEDVFVKIQFKSIIFLNLVKIIYMILLILLSLKYKEVDPKGESYGM